jgi:exonuclease SbcD
MSRGLRVLHTADVHLSDAVDPAARLRGWHAVLGMTNQADVLLVAGDLFDSARVPADLIDQVLHDLAEVRIPVVLLPGNHDLAGPGSVHERLNAAQAGSHVVTLDRPGEGCVQVPGLDVTVWGRAMIEHSPANRPLYGHVAPTTGRWHIVLAHGHVQTGTESSLRSSPIEIAEIAALGCDYLALGHWHRFHRIDAGPVLASYPGPPSPGWPGASATVNLVTLGGRDPVTVERLPVRLA